VQTIYAHRGLNAHHPSKIIVSPYCRVSTDKNDQANSYASQISYFSEYINRQENWELGQVYADEGLSGTSVKKRKQFNRMIEDALNGKINLIITKEVSRFARNTVDTLTYTRKLKERGVGVFFVSDNINTMDADGELRLTIMASLAQEESRKTSERVKWGQRRQMEKGVVFGRDLLGYTVKGGKLFVNEQEALIIQQIYNKYTIEGKGTWVIARELYEAGIKSKRVKEFSNTMILKVLKNEKYVGDLLQKKTFTPDYLTQSKKVNKGQEDKIYIRDNHEPIIERWLWDKTQQELERRSPPLEQKQRYSNRYWCSGKVRCECGQRYVSRTKALLGGVMHKAWRCLSAANHGTEKLGVFGEQVGCNSASINDKSLLALMSESINFVQQNKQSITKEILREIESVQENAKPVDTTHHKQRLEELQNKKTKAIDLMLDGIITKQDLKIQAQGYDKEIAHIATQLEKVEAQNNKARQQTLDLSAYESQIENIMQFGQENDLLYRELLDKIVIHKDKSITIYLNNLAKGIKIEYITTGKKDTFKVAIQSLEMVS